MPLVCPGTALDTYSSSWTWWWRTHISGNQSRISLQMKPPGFPPRDLVPLLPMAVSCYL